MYILLYIYLNACTQWKCKASTARVQRLFQPPNCLTCAPPCRKSVSCVCTIKMLRSCLNGRHRQQWRALLTNPPTPTIYQHNGVFYSNLIFRYAQNTPATVNVGHTSQESMSHGFTMPVALALAAGFVAVTAWPAKAESQGGQEGKGFALLNLEYKRRIFFKVR